MLNFNKTLLISKAALVLILGYMVVRTLLIPNLIENSLTPASVTGKDAVHPINSTTVVSQQDYDDIIRRNPFASSANAVAKTAGDSPDSDLSVSKELGIMLVGTVAGNIEISRAIIKNLKNSNMEIYRPGQTIGDAKIELIDTDTVVLSHNGQRKLLRIDNTWSNEYKTDYTPPPAGSSSYPVVTEVPQTQTGADMVGELFNTADFDPYEVNGQVEGLRITGIESLKIANYIGLKNGDIIRNLNGQKLTSRAKAYQALKKAGSEKTVNMELLRGDMTKQVSFTLP